MIITTYRILIISAVLAVCQAKDTVAANVTIDTVPVGFVGNPADTTGFGAVAYDYRIGTYEVTNAQYAAFLNAKAASDPLGLYNTSMGSGFGGITRSGSSGSYTYSTIPGRENKPVNWVTWYDAIRFANWLHNGQGSGDTETGAYTIVGGTATPSNGLTITRNPSAHWWLTSEDDWYKAAYHKNDGDTANYFEYPTSSDTTPTAEAPAGGSNSANYDSVVGDLTDVGAYVDSDSPYGTFDQGGNVWEWNESLVSGSFRGLLGGSFNFNAYDFSASDPSSFSSGRDPSNESLYVGFRVATVPEPSSLALAGFGALGLLFLARRKRGLLVCLFAASTASLLTTSATAAPITIDTVPVGNLGNSADTTGFGAVAYDYRIGTYEVTNAQYAAFLNEKAKSDPLGLYNTSMGSGFGGITRSGSSGSYTYSTISGRANKPVNYVSWYDAIRFANWLHNGQGTGDTETGAYTILGGTATPSNGLSITRNPNAQWFLTSEDEWYKAAYHKNDGNTANYFEYPTASDTPPVPGTPGQYGDAANYDNAIGDVINVGDFPTASSPYGTFDQGGNVWEWNETLIAGTERDLRGGSFEDSASSLHSSNQFSNVPTNERYKVGFRVATVPEPSSLALAALGAIGLLLLTRRKRGLLVCFFATPTALLLATPSLAAPVSFMGLGDLPGGVFFSSAWGVSPDGSVVVGSSSTSNSSHEAYRWTSGGGMVGLGDLPGGIDNSHAFAASTDGSVVVGRSRGALGDEAYRWTAAGGMVGLGDLPGGTFSSDARDVSANGSVVVGSANSASGAEAFRWTSGGGMVGLGDLPGGSVGSHAAGVSHDGSVVVGDASSASGSEAFRWTSGSGMVGLGDLPGGSFLSIAYGVSADGAVVVGRGTSAVGDEAFRWTSGGGMVGLGDLPGGLFFSMGRDVSGDGSVVVGVSASALGSEAFLWDETHGMRSLQDVLTSDLGLDLTGWTLREATGISADGTTIVGYGINPDGNTEAWVATVPEPSSLALAAFGAIGLLFLARRKRGLLVCLVAVSSASLFSAPATAAPITIDTVPVRNLGNTADTTGFGAVPYAYNIGTYEVTNSQYVAFLNAKAASDPLGLYNTSMASGYGGITRSGSSGNYSYAAIGGREDKPVNYVSWYDAIRFANWLHNGQGSGDTETGAYTILGGTATPSNGLGITRNPEAQWFLTSEDEWYKAAYHKNDGDTANYFEYPISIDTAPTAEAPAGGSNSANYDSVVGDLTDAGAYVDSDSPYGTFDQGGNVWEWNESLVAGDFRGLRGSAFDYDALNLSTSFSSLEGPGSGFRDVGFRVATVPEPSSLALAVLALLGGLLLPRRHGSNPLPYPRLT